MTVTKKVDQNAPRFKGSPEMPPFHGRRPRGYPSIQIQHEKLSKASKLSKTDVRPYKLRRRFFNVCSGGKVDLTGHHGISVIILSNSCVNLKPCFTFEKEET